MSVMIYTGGYWVAAELTAFAVAAAQKTNLPDSAPTG